VDLAFAPASFQAVERLVAAVRADAGHLYGALHRENPYAADARRALLDALSAADRALAAPPEGAAEEPPTIPDLGRVSPALSQAREMIDDVDREILALLARRALLSRRAAAAKAALGAAVRDPRREAELMEARRAEGAKLGLDPDSVEAIFGAILGFSRKLQER
jgi:prephenate dehydrogenase